ncbi:uncharacterized protein LOC110811665 [Carica papaya]|uniref:uncharacterized protein LOC110811665 n=1 Tax=Carica papaya TaxID=3649 RepID=UPI000B8CCC82|nr:uncharacterized protein LOC110811665 [Carica papaya]
MDDMAAYYAQPAAHYAYYQAPPPPPGATAPAPPQVVVPAPQHQLLHHPYVPHQPPPLSSYASLFASHSSRDEVRTLFIAGLPDDVKPREIYNLLREFPGYESSHLRGPSQSQNSQPFAFAVFSDQQSAVAAMHALNGMVFDLEKGSSLYIDLAKSNSRSKRSRADDEWPGSDKKARGSISRSIPDSGFGSVHLPGMSNSAYNTIGYSSTQSHESFDARAANGTASRLNNSTAQNATPCPTLFVANLGPTVTEQELTQVFSSCPGFLKLKMQSTYGAPVAFVDFQDTACSTGALNSLQGTILYSSSAGDGMRLEYARSRMGMRKKVK